jgi:hypothetical protein
MGIKPFFASAPRLKIKVGDVVLAYSIGINMNVSVDVRPVMVIGSYSPAIYEPVMYGVVSGSMQIVKMAGNEVQVTRKKAAKDQKKNDAVTDTLKDSDVLTSATKADANEDNSILKISPSAGKAALENHLNPAKVIMSETFDIILELELPGLGHKTLMTIKDCRLSGRSSNISMAQLTSEAVSFQGLLAIPEGQGFALDSNNKDG